LVGHHPGSIKRISVVVLTGSCLPDADSADTTKARGATRSRTPRSERDLDIFGIVYSTLISLNSD
jgi:hypothetical protein